MITGLYAALLAIVQLFLTFDVIRLRRSLKVPIGDGEHEILERRCRIHGNFIETVPIALILLLIAELSGAPYWLLHIMGACLLIGRIMHRFGLITKEAPMILRVGGMFLTLSSIIIGALTCFWFGYLLLI